MRILYSYLSIEGDMWDSAFCRIVDEKKYNILYSIYLCFAGEDIQYIDSIDNLLEIIKKIEIGELEYYETTTKLSSIDIYRDRVEFEDHDERFEKWSCTLEEYKRVLLGKRVFLMLPKEKESYLEIKINDIE